MKNFTFMCLILSKRSSCFGFANVLSKIITQCSVIMIFCNHTEWMHWWKHTANLCL